MCQTDRVSTKPQVLFVCVHNAGRSQMAAALTELHAGSAIEVRAANLFAENRLFDLETIVEYTVDGNNRRIAKRVNGLTVDRFLYQDQVNPVAVEAMAELGIDIRDRRSRLLSADTVEESDVVITMGCGDACPVYPGKRYLDWDLEDPAGRDLSSVREIRNEINRRVLDLVQSLLSNGSEWNRPTKLEPD